MYKCFLKLQFNQDTEQRCLKGYTNTYTSGIKSVKDTYSNKTWESLHLQAMHNRGKIKESFYVNIKCRRVVLH